MAISILIENNPNYTIRIPLGNILYRLDFLYNTLEDFWTFSIYNDDDNLLISGVKIVANYLLLENYKTDLLPSGDFYCLTSDLTIRIGRNSFVNNEADFLYLSAEEAREF